MSVLREDLADGVMLFCGDAYVLRDEVEFDALITDPPYGIGFSGKVTKDTDASGSETYPDSEDYFRNNVLPIVNAYLSKALRAAIFTGIRRLTEYPRPADIGGIIHPAGGGRSPWGFGCYNPVAFYGPSPFKAPTATVSYHPGMHITGERDGNNHPCPKPIAFMEWLIARASLPGEIVCDPFMGSGTTGVAAVKEGRRFVGVEIEPRYFDIACRRISDALSRPDLFIPSPKPIEKQEALAI